MIVTSSELLRRTLTGLAIGALGGAIFTAIGFPAGWLAGSMMTVVVAIYCGVKVELPSWLKSIAFILLGIQVGGSVTWDTVERAAQWPLSILLLGLTVIAVTMVCAQYFRRRHGWDKATSLFASLPGALSLTLALADTAKADMRRVTISQCVRLFFLVAALPAAITLMSPPQPSLPLALDPELGPLLLLIAVSALTGLVFEKLRIPAGLILGAITASVLLHLTGTVEGATPAMVLIPANVILGVMIGQRFQNLPFGDLKATFVEGFGGFALALAISVAGAALASSFGGLSFPLTLLAFAPGGLEAMTIMAFALNQDPAYVAAHQMARYLGICLVMPLIAAWLVAHRRAQGVVTTKAAASPLHDD